MKLERKLGFWGVFCLAAGAMISSGLFVLPGLAFAMTGPSMILSYALAAFLMVPAMLSTAELATAMPRSGGSYFFIERSMGAWPGVLAGLSNWFSIALKSAFALIGIGAFAELLLGGANEATIKMVAIGCCVLFALLNLMSVKGTGRLQVAMVVGLLGIMGLFVVVGFGNVNHRHYDNFMPNGLGRVFATAGLVFISYGGLTKIASVAEEVHNPGRNLPGGMFLAALVVSLLYIAATMITVGVLPAERLANPATGYVNYTPLSSAAGEFLGRPGEVVLAIAAILAFVTTANGGILAASRTPMAMSRDGLLPPALRGVSKRFGTPALSIALTSAFMIIALTALPIASLVKTASTMMLLLFALVTASVLIMRTSGVRNYRPKFRSPMFPWVQIIGIVFYAFLIVEMGAVPLIITGAFLAAGSVWFWVYVRGRVRRESALVYKVKLLVSREIYRSELEDELRELALERDAVVHDRFDELIRNCEILDIDGAAQAEDVFRQAAELLAPRLDIPAERLFELLCERERQSSTAILPLVAIPHVIVPGEGKFDILLVRCRGGMIVGPDAAPVKAAFILAGSADQRNYHLRALMAVAHIVQEHDFLRRWLEAGPDEKLRDIALLSARKREV